MQEFSLILECQKIDGFSSVCSVPPQYPVPRRPVNRRASRISHVAFIFFLTQFSQKTTCRYTWSGRLRSPLCVLPKSLLSDSYNLHTLLELKQFMTLGQTTYCIYNVYIVWPMLPFLDFISTCVFSDDSVQCFGKSISSVTLYCKAKIL